MALQLGGYGPPSEIHDLMLSNLHLCYSCAMPISVRILWHNGVFICFLTALCVYRQ